jgi:hypothetical protein
MQIRQWYDFKAASRIVFLIDLLLLEEHGLKSEYNELQQKLLWLLSRHLLRSLDNPFAWLSVWPFIVFDL